MYENGWSPFDPAWYKEAFDKFISTADQLFNKEDIVAQGYDIPDADGSRSSVFRRNAVLNNSFNENLLRETLKDIYLNSTHRLIAANHDNVHFFKWNGTMADVRIIPNTNYAEIDLPTETFIDPTLRDKYKRSQYYRQWVTITQLLNHWDTFKWAVMFFVDKRIYSEYMIRLDDQITTLRFPYYDHWVTNNYTLYVYKFDTNFQCRLRVSRELLDNPDRWDWQVPIFDGYEEAKAMNYTHVIAAFNRIGNKEDRMDYRENVDPMGDNIEFLPVDEDGIADLHNISEFNKNLVRSERTESLWMTVIVPKFMHEYPIPLATDIVFRPYYGKYEKVWALYNGEYKRVKINDAKNVYVNLDEKPDDWDDGWKLVNRPIVLSDAFNNTTEDVYENVVEQINDLKTTLVNAEDIVERFRLFVRNYTTDEEFESHCSETEQILATLQSEYESFLSKNNIEENTDYDDKMEEFGAMLEQARIDKKDYIGFKSQFTKTGDFWIVTSEIMDFSRELIDRYSIASMLKSIPSTLVWSDRFNNEQRFRRPVEENDFWMFEYDYEKRVWYPCVLEISHHFPDVYTIDSNPVANKIYKAFLFYSDTMNVREKTGPVVQPTPSWDKDMEEYMYDRGAVYRDIFMEKFYWMGVRSIYKGLIKTKYRWEVIEYIQDNDSYKRFNNLFLQTMDPYFKMGLATYLKSSNFEFPFDDAIAKMNEAINDKFLGYQRITNYEMYLNKTWQPSYFDYIVNIMDDWDWTGRLVRRPRSTFDTSRLFPIVEDVQATIEAASTSLHEKIESLITKLNEGGYHLQQEYLNALDESSSLMNKNMKELHNFMLNLDPDIYSIQHVNMMAAMLNVHLDTAESMREQFELVHTNAVLNSIYETKRSILDRIESKRDSIVENINDILGNLQLFDIEHFMYGVNNPDYFDHRDHMDDSCLIGEINQFNDTWTAPVKDARDALYVSTVSLWTKYTSDTSYSTSDLESLMDTLNTVKNDLDNLRSALYTYWGSITKYDDSIIAHLDFGTESIEQAISSMEEYIVNRSLMIDNIEALRLLLIEMSDLGLTYTEDGFVEIIDADYDTITTELSYLDKTDHIVNVNTNKNEIDDILSQWDTFILTEQEVFEEIISYTEAPTEFMNLMDEYKELIEDIVIYMNSVDTEFIPYDSLPNYSEYYKVSEIELINGGFNHTVGETVYIPSVGTYIITSIDGTTARATSLEDIADTSIYDLIEFSIEENNLFVSINSDDDVNLYIEDGLLILEYQEGYINPTERILVTYSFSINDNGDLVLSLSGISSSNATYTNPVSSTRLYDATTDGVGLGIIVKAVSVDTQPIINESVLEPYIEKAENIIYMINRDKEIINPYNNNSASVILDKIGKINVDWEELLTFYSDHMTAITITNMERLLGNLTNVEPILQNLMDAREQIDVSSVLVDTNNFITRSYEINQSRSKITPNYLYFDNRLRTRYSELNDFYGNGSDWNNADELNTHFDNLQYELDLFYRQIVLKMPDDEERDELIELHDVILGDIAGINNAINLLPPIINVINTNVYYIRMSIDNMNNFRVDEYYRITDAGVADSGSSYIPGDIVKLQYDTEDIFIQVVSVGANGDVTKIRPLMNYAITHLLYGTYETETVVGNGTGLMVNIVSSKLTKNDSTLFLDESSDITLPPQFDENDLFMFKFENIHDLPIGYEVFFAGKQVTDFISRHEVNDNPLHPTNIDVLYLKANDVIDLKNSSIRIEGDQYFIYKLDNVEILDPGAGYTKDQSIIVGTDKVPVKFQIDKLTSGPSKGIASIGMVENYTIFDRYNPASDEAEVIDDTLNNIDDEYHDGYYPSLTSEGIIKPISRELPIDEYNYIAKRYDDRDDGIRNKRYMYETVDMPDREDAATEGDPDYHTYLGSRIDNSLVPYENEHRWDGISPTMSHMDPFIPDSDRVPTGKPVRGEYQNIMQTKIHDSEVEDIDENVTSSILTVNGETIRPLDVSAVRNRLYGQIESTGIIPDYMDDSIVSSDPTDKIEIIEDDPDADYNVDKYNFRLEDTDLVADLPDDNTITLSIEEGDLILTAHDIINEDERNIMRYLFDVDDGVNLMMNMSTYRQKVPYNYAMITGDINVNTYADLPKHINEWEGVKVGSTAIVLHDETNENHRMLYRVRSYAVTGYIIFDEPEIADFKWTYFDVDWMNINFLPDLPTLKAQYPDADWRNDSYRAIKRAIHDGKVEREFTPKASMISYINNLTVDDLSVYNLTLHRWEDLTDEMSWRLTVRNDDENDDWGFRLEYLGVKPYAYEMILFLNKIPETQTKNAAMKRNAKFKISTYIYDEVDRDTVNISVNTGRGLRIRKLFPFEQKESYTISKDLGYEMRFKIANYIHFKNEIHLEDIKIFNKTAGRFESILDPNLFEVQFRDKRAVDKGYETQSNIVNSFITEPGEGFYNGDVWAYNEEFGVQIFGRITANFMEEGEMLTFIPIHCPNPPSDDVSLEFQVYQHAIQWNTKVGQIIVEFQTKKVEVAGDSWIHNVTNRMAPVPKEFKVICQYDLDEPTEYEIIIDKTPKTWTFIKPDWEIFPTFTLPDVNIQHDRIYITTPNGRIPLVNPSTGRPSMSVNETETGTDVLYLNLYNKYERLQIHSVPYPMRSVYVRRRVPENGFINLKGKLNKPLNKKYFEFWMNGRLLNDEVTIITPTKLFLHGLKSLRNFEIIEINRDSNEYFSDNFLGEELDEKENRPYPTWDFNSYLDDALEGELEGDNYTTDEQAFLLSPVWKQVEREHPEFKNYPPNLDIEKDILLRVDNYSEITGVDVIPYQFAVMDVPTIEGVPISGRSLQFSDFGFVPMSNSLITKIMDEIWEEEISGGEIPSHTIISDDEWYGMAVRLYDENGILVHTLNESAYKVIDTNILRINTNTRIGRIDRRTTTYDLD